jgi:hypothetical protein
MQHAEVRENTTAFVQRQIRVDLDVGRLDMLAVVVRREVETALQRSPSNPTYASAKS